MKPDNPNAPAQPSDPAVESLVQALREKAENLYLTRQFYCTESVLVALNQGLGGGLTDSQAIAVSAPFSIGVGESGCMCGALAGSILAAGLFVGGDAPYRQRKSARDNARQLHDLFKSRFGGTCCRVLRKKRSKDPNQAFKECALVTADAAEMTARHILSIRPELIRTADRNYLENLDSFAGGALRRISRFFRRG